MDSEVIWNDTSGGVALTRKENLLCVRSAIALCLRAGGVKEGMKLLELEFNVKGHEDPDDYRVWEVHSPHSLKDWIKDHSPILEQLWEGVSPV